MKGVIQEYVAMKPIRARTPSIISKFPTLNWVFLFRPVAAVLVGALFVSTASVSYAAEGALPGDILYTIKTRVNEPLKGALAFSAPAKQAWAMSVAGERIKEATTLAANGQLDAQTERQLQASFEEHARQASETMTTQASASPAAGAETAVRFEAQLSEYKRVLTEVGNVQGVSVSKLASSVDTEREHVASVRANAQARTGEGTTEDKTAAVARMRDAAKKQLDTSTKLARKLSGALSSSSAQRIAIQLQDASATISGGENFAENDAELQALGAFQKALTATEKLGVFLETSSDINKRTGFLISEPEKRTKTPAQVRQNGTEQKSKGGEKKVQASQQLSQETRVTAPAESVNAQNSDSMPTSKTSTRDTEQTAEQRTESSAQDGSRGNDTVSPEQQDKDESEQRGLDVASTIQSVLPISVPESMLP